MTDLGFAGSGSEVGILGDATASSTSWLSNGFSRAGSSGFCGSVQRNGQLWFGLRQDSIKPYLELMQHVVQCEKYTETKPVFGRYCGANWCLWLQHGSIRAPYVVEDGID